MQLEFQDKKDENVVLANVNAPDSSPIPNTGDRVDVPDLTEGAGHVHFLTVKSRWFIYGLDNKLSMVVFYCDQK